MHTVFLMELFVLAADLHLVDHLDITRLVTYGSTLLSVNSSTTRGDTCLIPFVKNFNDVSLGATYWFSFGVP